MNVTSPAGAMSQRPYPMGLMGVLATVGMLFAAFSAALLVRRSSADWVPVALPPIVWANTVVLALASVALALGRVSLRRGEIVRVRRWSAVAGLLGLLFLAGQVEAWRQLAETGVFARTNPHAAFFYVLSALHGVHVTGGLAALGWVVGGVGPGEHQRRTYGQYTHVAIYWHFLAGVWLWLLGLLIWL